MYNLQKSTTFESCTRLTSSTWIIVIITRLGPNKLLSLESLELFSRSTFSPPILNPILTQTSINENENTSDLFLNPQFLSTNLQESYLTTLLLIFSSLSIMTSKPNGVAFIEAFCSSVNILFTLIRYLVLQ